MRGSTALAQYWDEIAALAERVHGVDVRAYESMEPGRLVADLHPLVAGLLNIAGSLVGARLGEARLDFATELELSLRVQRACAKFRSRILASGEPTPETLHAHLRGAGTTIAMLADWETYPHLRVRDRLQLRDLQRRVLDWLRGSLAGPETGDDVPAATLEAPASLTELDDEVDALLTSADRGRAVAWLVPLERLAAQLRTGEGA